MTEVYRNRAEYLVKKSFVESFERLLQTNEFEDITTTQIINESGMSRTTFYRHFKDKFDLAVWEYCQMQVRKPKTIADGDENIKNMVYFLDEHRATYKKLFRYKGQNDINDFYLLFCDHFVEEIAMTHERKLSIKEIYVNRYHCMGCLAVLREWILSDDPLSKEEVLDIIISESRGTSIRKLYLSK